MSSVRWRACLVAAAIAGGAAHPLGSPDAPPASWIGTWKLNVARSSYPGTFPYKRATRRIVASSGDRLTIVDDLVRIRGGILHLEWTGTFDGLDYPVQGVDVVLTTAYRRLDDRTWELVQKVDGRVTATTRLAVSGDGTRLTSVSAGDGPAATSVYERQ